MTAWELMADEEEEEVWDSVDANLAFARTGARARSERAAALVAVLEASIVNGSL